LTLFRDACVVPRNRVDLDRDRKVDEILSVAARQLRARGYTDLSVDRVARELGVARNAVYWYFRSQDELFVQTAARILADAWRRPVRTTDVERRILWALDRLSELQPLMLGLQERVPRSAAAAALVEQFQAGLCDRLREVLRGHVRELDLDLVADTVMTLGQGLLSRGVDARERARIVRFTLQRVARVTPSPS
jgi:AcrR family transcriptional regulator